MLDKNRVSVDNLCHCRSTDISCVDSNLGSRSRRNLRTGNNCPDTRNKSEITLRPATANNRAYRIAPVEVNVHGHSRCGGTRSELECIRQSGDDSTNGCSQMRCSRSSVGYYFRRSGTYISKRRILNCGAAIRQPSAEVNLE